MMQLLYVFLIAGMFTFFTSSPLAASESSTQNILLQMQEQMKQMQEQIQELQQRNAELEQKINEQQEFVGRQQEIVGTPTGKIDAAEQVVPKPEKVPVLSHLAIELYGYIKLDAAFDTARVNSGNYALWAESRSLSGNDDQFNMTVNQTRFGLNISGPEMGKFETRGKIEVDFYGSGPENKPRMRMRHAYMEVLYPEYEFTLLAGQTYDVVSPLLPQTVNFLVEYDSGNIGYRHPQIRATKEFTLGLDSSLEVQAALSRTIGDESPFGSGDSGEDSGFPTTQGRIAYSFPLLAGKTTTIGLSGHYGQEEYDINPLNDYRIYDTWSANLDLTLPLLDNLSLKSELFTGENLDDFYGGIGQGVNVTAMEGIRTWGGWFAFAYKPWERWLFNAGAGLEDPEDDDLNSRNRAKNASIFGNVFYQWNNALLTALELSYWDTEYIDLEDGEALRLQAALIYNF